MRVFFVRHGQSQDNRDKKASGWSKSPLSELGHAQAKTVEPILRDIKFDRIFSSDLLRTRQTAADAIPGCDPILSDKIREISVGSISGTTRVELEATLGDTYRNALKNHDYTVFGGENDDMVHERVSAFMHELEALEGCENVVVFGHEGTVHQMLNYVLNTRVDLKSLRVPNCSVTVFVYIDGRWKLEKFAYTAKIIPDAITMVG